MKKINVFREKILFATDFGLIKCLKQIKKNRDCSLRAHLFLSYYLIYVLWDTPQIHVYGFMWLGEQNMDNYDGIENICWNVIGSPEGIFFITLYTPLVNTWIMTFLSQAISLHLRSQLYSVMRWQTPRSHSNIPWSSSFHYGSVDSEY